MPRIKLDLQKHHNAMLEIRNLSLSKKPIKMMEFIEKFSVDNTIFKVMEDLKMIRPNGISPSGGIIYSWIYVQPSNETDSKVSVKIVDTITENKQASYLKYSSEEYKRKKKMEEMKRKLQYIPPFKEEIHESASEDEDEERCEPLMESLPVELPVVEHTLEIPVEHTKPQGIVGGVTSSSEFKFNGTFTKEEVLAKISILLGSERIQNFSISVEHC